MGSVGSECKISSMPIKISVKRKRFTPTCKKTRVGVKIALLKKG